MGARLTAPTSEVNMTDMLDVVPHLFAPSPADIRKCVYCLGDKYDRLHKRSLDGEAGDPVRFPSPGDHVGFGFY